MDPAFAARAERLVLLGEAATLRDPGKSALHHPPARDHREADLSLLLAYDVEDPAAELSCPADQSACIGAVGPDPLQARRSAVQPVEHLTRSVTVLHLGAVYHAGEQKPVGVYEDVAFAARDLLARVVAVGIPLFPAVFTLYVSSTAAVGVRVRPCFTRVCSRSTSWMRSSVLFFRQRRKWS
jgi:hypothetical protein